MLIIEKRWKKIQNLPLKFGTHKPDSQFCVMEAAAYIAGEPWSDHPACVPQTITAVLRRWNDALPSDRDRDRLLKPFLPRIIGLRADAETEMRRAVMCGDFALRFVIPECLRYVKKNELAEQLAATPESTTQAELGIAAKSVRNKLRVIASASASASDIASAIDIAINQKLEASKSALVERMISCAE
jgi:hypothetical protein